MKTVITLQPVVYEHAAAFINKSPWQVSQSARFMAEAHIAAYKVYHHSPITVGIDIYNIEPECYGAVVPKTSGNEVPTITDFPFSDPQELLDLAPMDITHSGRWPLLIEAAKIIRENVPEDDIRIPLGGSFSIAINLCGFENFLFFAIMNEEVAGEILLKLARNQVSVAAQIKEQGFGVTFFESAAAPPLLSPDMFRSLELPALLHIITEINSIYENKTPLIMGGDTATIARDIAEAGAGFLICPAETDQQLFLEQLKGLDIAVRINMDAAVLATGKMDEISEEINRIAALCKSFPGTLLGTGVLPYDADPNLVTRLLGYEYFVQLKA